jgi:hypothetical protein
MTKKLTGTEPYQTPLNADLGTMAYQDADALGNITASSATLGGRTSSTSGQIDLTIRRSQGGGGALKLIGDGYLTGGSHVIFEHTASSGASATTQNISYDGTQIYTNGNFKVSGLTFDTASGNTKTPTGLTMEDYEEGTWTPNFTTTGTDFSNASVGSASYVKIGKQVTIQFNCVLSGSTTGGTGDVIITGLPFTVGETGYGTCVPGRITFTQTSWMSTAVPLNTTNMAVYITVSGANAIPLPASQVNGNGTPYFSGTLTYWAA